MRRTTILISTLAASFSSLCWALSWDSVRESHVEGITTSLAFELLDSVEKDGVKFKDWEGEQKAKYVYYQRIVPTDYIANGQDLPSLNSAAAILAGRETLHLKDLAKAVTRKGDEFAGVDDTGKPVPAADVKTFHSFGSTALVEFVAAPNKTNSGMYKGAWGLLRFSYAGPTNFLGNIPGMGLKLFVKGGESQNLVAMNSLVSQGPNTNVFLNDFSNIFHILSGNPDGERVSEHPKDTGGIAARKIMALVEKAFLLIAGPSHQTFYVQADHLAKVDQAGRTDDPAATPTWLYFVPNANLKAQESGRDFRADLAQLTAGTVLYQVYALNPASTQAVTTTEKLQEAARNGALLGTIQLRSPFVASSYGDFRLFVKHKIDWIQDEFKESPAQQKESLWRSMKCSFDYWMCENFPGGNGANDFYAVSNCKTKLIQGIGSKCSHRRTY